MKRQMRLAAFVMSGPAMHHHGGWRHPEAVNGFLDPAFYEDVARTLEQGKFDLVFFADSIGLLGNYRGSHDALVRRGGQMGLLDPVPILSMMARATKHIGLATTISTTFFTPYQIARTLGTLDVLSGGRVAWNVVTSSSSREAQNFGMNEIPPRSERYARAEEVVDACIALWNSWASDAIIMDRKSGTFADPAKVKSANFKGAFVQTAGPLTTPRSAQGHPVIMQAGSSEQGRELGARIGEIIFSVKTEGQMKSFYDDMRQRMRRVGRSDEECAILTCVDAIIGETESIAREKQAYVNSLVHEESALALASSHIGFDLSLFPLDLPLEAMEVEEGSVGVIEQMVRVGGAGLTLREAVLRYATHMMCPQIVGTAEQVADRMQDIFESGKCDGFVMTPIVHPTSFEEFTRSVVPILQERAIYKMDYSAPTLRQSLRA